MQPLISVIVPVYRVEEYLPRCVDSILAQTYTNLEVILVDDGSPDNCGAICDEYAAKDARVKVIHKENGGQSSARTIGLQMMRGEYVAFVDSDDWIAPDLYESLLTCAPFDAVLFGFTYVYEATGEQRIKYACEEPCELVWAKDTAQTETLVKNSLFGYACNKVFRREVVEGITFPTAILREDLVFNMKAFSRTEKVLLHNHTGYYYRQRAGSMLTKDYCGAVPDIVGAAKEMQTVHPQLPKSADKKLSSHLIKAYVCDMLYKFVFRNVDLSDREKFAETKKVIASETLAQAVEFECDENKLYTLLTWCIKRKLPRVFYYFVKGKWHG